MENKPTKHIMCRTVNCLDDIELVDQLCGAEVRVVSRDGKGELILTLETKANKANNFIQIHLRNE